MLDNTIFTLGAGMGDGTTHQYNDLPIVVAGGGGALKLGKLATNGGPTKTVALKKGSRAINHAGPDAPELDQRGVKRGKKPDIGAYERVKKKQETE